MKQEGDFRAGWAMVLCCFLFSISTLDAEAITLTGANGRAVEFAGIKDATAKGITGQVTPTSDLIGVPWEKLDLEALKQENPLIFQAYQRAVGGTTVSLNLGTYAPAAEPGMEQETTLTKVVRYPGWEIISRSGAEFLLKLPRGNPEGILLISSGDRGDAVHMAVREIDGVGHWDAFQNEHRFALLTYDRTDAGLVDPTEMNDFYYADRGSGEVTLEVIGEFASRLNVPVLNEVPIAVFGSGRTGATFAYSFVHHRPERILTAVLSKGAFYEAEPTEASIQIPVLFIWGQYSNNAEIWQSENTVESIFANELVPRSNWTSAREFRGQGYLTAACDHFTNEYLLEMISMRLAEEKAAPAPKAEESEVEGTDAEEPDSEKESAFRIKPLDRGQAYVGTMKSRETRRMSSPDTAMDEGETFLPNQKIAELWKGFLDGSMKVPEPPPIE